MSSSLKNLSDFSHLEVGHAAGLKVAIVVAQWNAQITGALLDGAVNGLLQHGAQEHDIEVVQVPGSYELISGADIILRDESFDAVICLGCVIQGETRHFDFICDAVGHGIANVALKYNKPVIFGVLTTDNEEQALDRAGGKHGNKGEEAAITAIQMALLSHKYR
ncbi:6,7-dimethyl-8-ribityllumazine synthase [Sphingobacterium oryzagri]|uniref:6,7-dimethyl-8-ribityllumazine synthase n=1 Tax=Sphingobacterium oryzagri TaxID=3025669 RepID=A0ABY7WI37_9SPHI|nr:6,7-dimethyl-8-ribityllumazine synthase [Sphingobacterium sp. KACC 22765]WDF69227.1 6,7-dimethyl-8-ribityllumazine synthase [Sphingobacterium sp. KACC 22765]